MNHLKQLEEYISRLPGIGPRHAKRIVHYILSKPNKFAEEFSDVLKNARENTKTCNTCFALFSENGHSGNTCAICESRKNSPTLMVVAKTGDVEHLEKNDVYHGLYFVLGDTIPLIRKKNRMDHPLHTEELKRRVKSDQNITDIILAFNANADGENTTLILEDELRPICEETKKTISVLGRGLSTGTEIEYADKQTMEDALKSKKIV